MHIEKHTHADGSESELRKLFSGSSQALKGRLAKAYAGAMKKDTCHEVRQVQFDPDDPCPCGSRRKAKNCCAGRLLRRLAAERAPLPAKGDEAVKEAGE